MKEVLGIVQYIVESKGEHTVVTDGWWSHFCNRHPQLTLRIAIPLSYIRAMPTDDEVVSQYYDMLEDTLVGNNDPHRIYNCDETGLPLNPKQLKVVDTVGARNPSHIIGNRKSQITVLACTNAAGSTLPPFAIFDRKSLNPQMIKGESSSDL